MLSFLAYILFKEFVNEINQEQTESNNTLEIYTLEDIYYIDQLKVTTESGKTDTIFTTTEELNHYIAKKTIEDNVEGFVCLNKNK